MTESRHYTSLSPATARRALVADHIREGRTLKQTAAVLGVGKATVIRDLRWLRDHGHDIRTPPTKPRGAGRTPFSAARLRSGLTQPALADRAGVALYVVRRAEVGTVHRDSAQRLADALGSRVADLWPEAPEPGQHRRPPIPDADEDPAWERRQRVAELHAADKQPGEIARTVGISRATVYRDIDALRASGWVIPPRPMGRPPRTSSDEPLTRVPLAAQAR